MFTNYVKYIKTSKELSVTENWLFLINIASKQKLWLLSYQREEFYINVKKILKISFFYLSFE